MTNISFYGSHNATYVVEKDGEILTVLEMERFLNYKNSGLAQYMVPKTSIILFLAEYIPKYIQKKYDIEIFDNCYYMNSDVIIDKKYDLEKYIPSKNYIHGLHHESHAAGCFYQSPFEEALIFSFDGGGNDGKFNVYKAKRGEDLQLLERVLSPLANSPHIYYDLGFPYMVLGDYLNDIKRDPLNIGNLVYPGKIMGLASYGKVRKRWLSHFMDFYKSDPSGIRHGGWGEGSYYDYEPKIKNLGDLIHINFDTANRLSGQIAYDVAMTSQVAFEECFLEIADPYIKKYQNLPICITGGCGLNIILNTRVKNQYQRPVFVGPNPNDCGIALGLMLNKTRPKEPFNATYSGIEILDMDTIPQYLNESRYAFETSTVELQKLAYDITQGNIVGVVRGKSEHGPRALGNRSILCNPCVENMKDILNHKVKNREWYRPFAPVVRLEDVSKYFEWEGESTWMSFCPKVKKEWRKTLSAITHVDNTARVQTVTRQQNEWLYDLLCEMEKQNGVGVLLNTSFNVNGKPIVSTVRDAFFLLENTQMDSLVIENYYFKKS